MGDLSIVALCSFALTLVGYGNLLTTLLCIFLSTLLARRLELFDCVAGLFSIPAAAAIEIPDTPERSTKGRLKAEENSLAILFYLA